MQFRYFLFLLFFIPTLLLADRDTLTDLIIVKSESMQLNRQTGRHTLLGNVVITHHDITISADTIQITRSNSAISRITGVGSPLRFEQRLANGDSILIESGELDYKTPTWKIVLRGDVMMQKGRSKIQASVVEYNLRNKSYTAKNADSNNSQVEFTYFGLNR